MNMFDDHSDEALLEALSEERSKTSETALFLWLIAELQRRGVYPQETVPGNPNTVETMVRGWGSRWHVWSGPETCRHCGKDLRDQKSGPPFKLEIGIIENDRCAGYKCPRCGEWL